MPHSDFILLIYTGSHDLLNGFHVYLVLGVWKFGIEDQVDLAGAERWDDLEIVGGAFIFLVNLEKENYVMETYSV